MEKERSFGKIFTALQKLCFEWKMIDLKRLAIDGFFPPEKVAVRRWTTAIKGKASLRIF